METPVLHLCAVTGKAQDYQICEIPGRCVWEHQHILERRRSPFQIEELRHGFDDTQCKVLRHKVKAFPIANFLSQFKLANKAMRRADGHAIQKLLACPWQAIPFPFVVEIDKVPVFRFAMNPDVDEKVEGA